MLEVLLSPRRAERESWEMLVIGFFYASLSVLMVNWFFGKDPVMSKYSGILIVTFTVMFSLPFVYFLLRIEEEKDVRMRGIIRILKEHEKGLKALLWLFLGFLIGYSTFYIILPKENFAVQIETYCSINKPNNFENCLKEHGITGKVSAEIINTKFISILSNNLYVLLFTVIFSLIFGAGAIFILAWNASVIAAAVGIYTKSRMQLLPIGLMRYMGHGIFEIAAYFFGALAGGILSVSISKKEYKNKNFYIILEDVFLLIIIAILILIFAAFIEVYITPKLF